MPGIDRVIIIKDSIVVVRRQGNYSGAPLKYSDIFWGHATLEKQTLSAIWNGECPRTRNDTMWHAGPYN
jgi:hypothetical protein